MLLASSIPEYCWNTTCEPRHLRWQSLRHSSSTRGCCLQAAFRSTAGIPPVNLVISGGNRCGLHLERVHLGVRALQRVSGHVWRLCGAAAKREVQRRSSRSPSAGTDKDAKDHICWTPLYFGFSSSSTQSAWPRSAAQWSVVPPSLSCEFFRRTRLQ